MFKFAFKSVYGIVEKENLQMATPSTVIQIDGAWKQMDDMPKEIQLVGTYS